MCAPSTSAAVITTIWLQRLNWTNISLGLYCSMPWAVFLHDAFEAEFETLPFAVKEALAASATLLRTYGPMLSRPHADTLTGSRHANMKELRFSADDGAWRSLSIRRDEA
jgi:hypothetical protein